MNYKSKLTNFLKHSIFTTFTSNVFNSFLIVILSSLIIGSIVHIDKSSCQPLPEIILWCIQHLYSANIGLFFFFLFMMVLAQHYKNRTVLYVFNAWVMDIVALGTGITIGFGYNQPEGASTFIIAGIIGFLMITFAISATFPLDTPSQNNENPN